MSEGRVNCYFAPRHCHLGEGPNPVSCFIRVNSGGKKLLQVRLRFTGLHAKIDFPLRKSRSTIFFRATAGSILIGTGAGCNMGCFFAREWRNISKSNPIRVRSERHPTPEEHCRSGRSANGCPFHRLHLPTRKPGTIWGRVRSIEHRHPPPGESRHLPNRTWVNQRDTFAREAFHDIIWTTWGTPAKRGKPLKSFHEGFYGRVTLTHLAARCSNNRFTWGAFNAKETTKSFWAKSRIAHPPPSEKNDEPARKSVGLPIGFWSSRPRRPPVHFTGISTLRFKACAIKSPNTPPGKNATRRACA